MTGSKLKDVRSFDRTLCYFKGNGVRTQWLIVIRSRIRIGYVTSFQLVPYAIRKRGNQSFRAGNLHYPTTFPHKISNVHNEKNVQISKIKRFLKTSRFGNGNGTEFWMSLSRFYPHGGLQSRCNNYQSQKQFQGP